MKKLNGSSRVFFCVFFLIILCCNFITLKVIHNDKYGNKNTVNGFVNYNDTVIMPEDQQTQMQNEPQSLDNEGGESSNSEADRETIASIEKDNIKTLYSVNTTIWTLAMSTFAVFFQFNSNRDAQGYNPKGVHFRILNLEARLKEFEKDRSGKRGMASNEIPLWVFTPFYGYFISLIVTTVFYFFSVECEKCRRIDNVLFLVFFVSIVIAIVYIVILLISMYSQRYIVSRTLRIIKKTNRLIKSINKKRERYVEYLTMYDVSDVLREKYKRCQIIAYDAFDVLSECSLADNRKIKEALGKYELNEKIKEIEKKIKRAEEKATSFDFLDRFRLEENDNINIQLGSKMLFILYKNYINENSYRLFIWERKMKKREWMNDFFDMVGNSEILHLFIGIGLMYTFKKYLDKNEIDKAVAEHECDSLYNIIYRNFLGARANEYQNNFFTFYRYIYEKKYSSDRSIHNIKRVLEYIYPDMFMEER